MPPLPTPPNRRLSKNSPRAAKGHKGGSHPEAEEVELWAEDEARIGLKPVVRRVWAPVGRRPTARVKRGYEWSYLYGLVRPTTGEVWWLILPTVNKELFSMALGEFAKEVGAGKHKRILLVLDQAGWHTSGEIEVPEGTYTFSSFPRALRSYTAGGEVVACEQ